jgi:gamma-glutamyl hercynylcysteine S-oxide synthase
MEPSLTALPEQLVQARAATDCLFQCIDPAAFFDRPIPERHRIIFYLGHLDAFDWNQLKQCGMTAKSPRPGFDDLFAFGIDPEPGQLPSDTVGDWPSIAEVHTYNRGVREIVDRELIHAPEQIVHMMIEHRHMHAETFAYILHNLDPKKKMGPWDPLLETAPVEPRLTAIPAGRATLGRREEAGFGWDNEFREFEVDVPEFAIGRYKVSNGEYLEFVREGGLVPHYWLLRDGAWSQRGMFQDVPLPLDWPVYATWEQARAYATWRGATIPAEAQYHRAAFGTPDGTERLVPWNGGNGWHGNFGYRRWDPVPVNASPASDSAFGIAQTVGNGWEWTSTLFAPFEGFTPHPTYAGYSANFFDSRHYVMKGASPRTADKLVRRSLRNWFRPEYPYVYATFRVVQN